MATCNKPGHDKRRADGRCILCLKAAQQRHYRANMPEYKRAALDWSKRNPEKRRAIGRRFNYGRQADSVRACPVFCEICGTRQATDFDHDHVTGKFRGWLCVRCNSALAAFGDNVVGVLKALGYLLSC